MTNHPLERFWNGVFDERGVATKLEAGDTRAAIEAIVESAETDAVEYREGSTPSRLRRP